MQNITAHDGDRSFPVYIQWSLIFDFFQVIIIISSLCGGFCLLFLIPFAKRRNIMPIWMIILFGFIHEFYSVLILFSFKFRLFGEEVCTDNHSTTMTVAAFILGTILTSAIKANTKQQKKSMIYLTLVWVYIICCVIFLTERKYDVRFSNLHISVQEKMELRLTSCGGNFQADGSPLLYDYAFLYLPILVIFVLIQLKQKPRDYRFWTIQTLPNCSEDELCSICRKHNEAIQIVLTYISVTIYIFRPLFIVYHFLYGGMYYNVMTGLIVVATYCFLCLDTFSNLKRCRSHSERGEKFIL